MLWYPCAAHLVVGIDEIGHRYRPTRVRLFGCGEPRYLKASHRLRQRRFDSEDEAARAAVLELRKSGYLDDRLRLRRDKT